MLQSALGTLLGFVNNFLEFLGKVWNGHPRRLGPPTVPCREGVELGPRLYSRSDRRLRHPDYSSANRTIRGTGARQRRLAEATKAEVTKLIRQVFVDHDLMGALKGTFNLILRTFNIPPDLAVTVAQKALAAWDIVVKKPLEFIKNTVRALGHGFKLLWANITDHLEYGIKGWLLGSIADKDIQFPRDWTKPREVFGFVMDVLGLNVSHIFELLKELLIPHW